MEAYDEDSAEEQPQRQLLSKRTQHLLLIQLIINSAGSTLPSKLEKYQESCYFFRIRNEANQGRPLGRLPT